MSTLLGRLITGAVLFLTTLVVLAQPTTAVASTFDVYVGYSDGLRGPGFFPNPWSGDPGVTFQGSSSPYDAGAIMIVNTSGASLSIDSAAVSINGLALTGSGYAPFYWTFPVTLAAGNALILTQTTQYNFDTSDYATITSPGVPVTNCTVTCPTVTIGAAGGSPQTFLDTAHTLDTLGYDFAYNGANESFNWRLIGTCSGPGCGTTVSLATPLPATLPLFVSGLGAMGLLARRRKKKTAAIAAA
jgi:hypothetical protein